MSIPFLLVAAALAALTSAHSCPNRLNFAVGSYTDMWWLPTSNGSGVVYVTLSSSGLKTSLTLSPKIAGHNPSYCARGRENALYCASALMNSTVVRIANDSSVSFGTSPLKQASHLAVLPVGGRHGTERVLMAHYGESGVTSFLRNGNFYKPQEFEVPKKFASTPRGQQSAPHPHHILPLNNGDVLVPDLGADRVWKFGVGFDGELYPKGGLKMRFGDGPRHAARGPGGDVYVVNELSNTVSRVMGCGGFRECERFNLLDGKNKSDTGISSAAIRVTGDGKYLYASVRRPDKELGAIVGFALRNGAIVRNIGVWSSHGVHPRDFNIVENGPDCKSFVAITNMNSDNLVFVERNKKNGLLSRTPYAQMTVYTPTSVLEVGVVPVGNHRVCAKMKVPPKVRGAWGRRHSDLWWRQFRIWKTRKLFCFKCMHLC